MSSPRPIAAPPADGAAAVAPEKPKQPIDRLVEAELALVDPDGRLHVAPGEKGTGWLEHPPRDLFGLALSGGGIRSATFNLGLLQGLSELGLLRPFDYLSTVSGGGYIGSFWTMWRHRDAGRAGTLPEDAPPGFCEPREVRHLREFSNFLAPRMGIFSYDTGRLIVNALSAMVPSLLAAFSVIALAMLAWAGLAWLTFSPVSRGLAGGVAPAAVVLGITLVVLAGFELAWLKRREYGRPRHYVGAAVLGLGLTGAAWWAVGRALPSTVYWARQALPVQRGEALGEAAYVLAPAAAWGGALLVLVLLRWFLSTLVRNAGFQQFRAASDRVRSRLLLLALAWTAVSLLWFAGVGLESWAVEVGGVTGVLMAVFAKVQQLLSREKSLAGGGKVMAVLRPMLPRLLAYLTVVLMVVCTAAAISSLADDGAGVLAGDLLAVSVGPAIVVLLVLFLMDPNEVGLHSFYRARLARAYLGASNDVRTDPETGKKVVVPNRETEALPGDDYRLDELAGASGRPFHLVCCAANDLASSDDMANLYRGADSAVLSRAGCSVGAAWAPWDGYRTSRIPTLASAVTASGAAFNTLMGSKSIQLGPAVTFLAAALNLRLGMWVAHPENRRKDHRRIAAGAPFFSEMFGLANARGSRVHLSDGAHFENLAIYELIRRHCRVIVASDCGADPTSSFDDLGNLVRRVREDFGVDVRIDTRPLLPDEKGISKQHMVAGDIHYPDGDTGVLLLFKPVLVGNEPVDVSQYRTRNAAFPHETTLDQFYDEAQWESYRRLGKHAARSAFREILDDLRLRWKERAGETDDQLRPLWREAFARTRRDAFPEPAGYDDRLSRFAGQVAELDALLRSDGCELLLHQVYKELPEHERKSRIPLGDMPVKDPEGKDVPRKDEGGDRDETGPEPRAVPGPEDLSQSLYLIRRTLLLMEEIFQNEDLARNYAHPLYLGVMNWFARWAYAPLFRMWWPLLKTMYPEAFTRFLEQQFRLRSVERPEGPDHGGAGEKLEPSVRENAPGFARDCWVREGRDEKKSGSRTFSYHLRMFYEGRARYEVQAAQVSADAIDGALVWDARDFFVPPGLWGVGIGSEFLKALREGQAPEACIDLLAVRVAYDPTAGAAGLKRAADEVQLYRSAGFVEAGRADDGLRSRFRVLDLPESWKSDGEAKWMVATARVRVPEDAGPDGSPELAAASPGAPA